MFAKHIQINKHLVKLLLAEKPLWPNLVNWDIFGSFLRLSIELFRRLISRSSLFAYCHNTPTHFTQLYFIMMSMARLLCLKRSIKLSLPLEWKKYVNKNVKSYDFLVISQPRETRRQPRTTATYCGYPLTIPPPVALSFLFLVSPYLLVIDSDKTKQTRSSSSTGD